MKHRLSLLTGSTILGVGNSRWTQRAPALGLWLLIVLGPPLALAAEAAGAFWSQEPSGRGAWLALAWPSAARVALLARSVALAGGAALAATGLGFLAATVLWRSPWRRGRWLLLALAPLPPYVHALAWTTARARWSALSGGAWASSDSLAHGAVGAGWVQTMAVLPLATGLALVALELLPRDVLAAARVARGEGAVLRKVVLPLCAPLLTAAAGILFALLLLDYSVPALFQVEVYALALFADYSAHGSAARATLAAVPLVALAAAAVMASLVGLRRAALQGAKLPLRTDPTTTEPLLAWPPAWQIARAFGSFALALHLIVPLVFLTLAAGSGARILDSMAAASGELRFSLITAGGAALLGLPLAGAAAGWLESGRRRAWLLVLAPLALPAPLVAIGFIALWNRPGVAGYVYDVGPGPALVALARFAPLAALVMLAWRSRRDPLPLAAGRLMAGAPWRRALGIDLPLAATGLAASAALLFALTLGELGATLLVVPPGRATLAMRIFNYLHYGASDAVAGLCLAMALLTALCGAMALSLLAKPVVAAGRA